MPCGFQVEMLGSQLGLRLRSLSWRSGFGRDQYKAAKESLTDNIKGASVGGKKNKVKGKAKIKSPECPRDPHVQRLPR